MSLQSTQFEKNTVFVKPIGKVECKEYERKQSESWKTKDAVKTLTEKLLQFDSKNIVDELYICGLSQTNFKEGFSNENGVKRLVLTYNQYGRWKDMLDGCAVSRKLAIMDVNRDWIQNYLLKYVDINFIQELDITRCPIEDYLVNLFASSRLRKLSIVNCKIETGLARILNSIPDIYYCTFDVGLIKLESVIMAGLNKWRRHSKLMSLYLIGLPTGLDVYDFAVFLNNILRVKAHLILNFRPQRKEGSIDKFMNKLEDLKDADAFPNLTAATITLNHDFDRGPLFGPY